MKEFPVLYKRDQNGNVREWKLSVKGNKIKTVHGVKDGKYQVDSFECFGKNIGRANETSDEEQALLEAESLFKKRLEQGGYKENIEETDVIEFSPMLAQKYELKRIKFPWFIQRKYDGVRTYYQYEKMLSRAGKEFYNLEHLSEKISHINDKFNVILDGELYNHEMEFEEIVSFLKQKNQRPEGIEDIHYIVFDLFKIDDEDMEYKDRLDLINIIARYITEKGWQNDIKIAQTYVVNNAREVESRMNYFINTGFEGAILRDPSGKYVFNRTFGILKYKRIMEEEFKIVDVIDGKGREKGLAIFVCVTEEGEPFRVRPKGTHESRRKMFEESEKYIGKLYTVEFFSYTNYSVPRFPRGKAVRDYE